MKGTMRFYNGISCKLKGTIGGSSKGCFQFPLRIHSRVPMSWGYTGERCMMDKVPVAVGHSSSRKGYSWSFCVARGPMI